MKTTDYEANRKQKNEEAGLVRVNPTYWVHADKREEALKRINMILSDPEMKKPYPRY